jgi:hypothetical protein
MLEAEGEEHGHEELAAANAYKPSDDSNRQGKQTQHPWLQRQHEHGALAGIHKHRNGNTQNQKTV